MKNNDLSPKDTKKVEEQTLQNQMKIFRTIIQ